MPFESHVEYLNYLNSIKDRLPAAAYEFATAEWHYNHDDPRLLHDSWVESVIMVETKENPKSRTRYDAQHRQLQITVRLVSRWQEGYAELAYKNVYAYQMQKFREDPHRRWANAGHHDLLTDEIRLSEREKVIHEVEFAMGYWLIECEDISYAWEPFDK